MGARTPLGGVVVTKHTAGNCSGGPKLSDMVEYSSHTFVLLETNGAEKWRFLALDRLSYFLAVNCSILTHICLFLFT